MPCPHNLKETKSRLRKAGSNFPFTNSKLISLHPKDSASIRYVDESHKVLHSMPKDTTTDIIPFRRSPLSHIFFCLCRIRPATDESRNLYPFYSIIFLFPYYVLTITLYDSPCQLFFRGNIVDLIGDLIKPFRQHSSGQDQIGSLRLRPDDIFQLVYGYDPRVHQT